MTSQHCQGTAVVLATTALVLAGIALGASSRTEPASACVDRPFLSMTETGRVLLCM